MRRFAKEHTVPPVSLAITTLVAALILSGCGNITELADQETNVTLAGASSTTESRTTEHCERLDGMPIVWPAGVNRTEDKLDDWQIEDSTFVIMSGFWALNPNPMMAIAAEARSCVDPDDQWMLVAQPPGIAQEDPRWPVTNDLDPRPVDAAVWGTVTAHPWRLVSQGPAGGSGEPPHYRGVARFTDQAIVTSAACDTRVDLVRWIGKTIVPVKWPASFSTELCMPPPGVEALAFDRASEWYLPIGGTLALDGDTLVVLYDGIEYRYEAITDEEFAAEFNRDSFTTIEDPLNPLVAHLGGSFEEYDSFYDASEHE